MTSRWGSVTSDVAIGQSVLVGVKLAFNSKQITVYGDKRTPIDLIRRRASRQAPIGFPVVVMPTLPTNRNLI